MRPSLANARSVATSLPAVLPSLAAWLVVLPFAVWALVRVAGSDLGWPAPQLLAFTPLALLGAALAVGLMLVLRRWAPAAVAALAAIALAVVIAPRALGDGAAAPAGGGTLRVLTLNLHGDGANPQEVGALVRRTDADVFSVQEVSAFSIKRLDDAGIRDVLPNLVAEARPLGQGTALYAKVRLRREPRPRGFLYALAAARARVPGAGGRELRVLSVHTSAPAGRSFIPGWRRDFGLLPEARDGDLPRVLAGDFNATLDHRPMRDVIDTGYRDAGDETGKGLTPTWPNGRRFPPLVTIDHVLADDRLDFGEVSVHDVNGSDHRAVFAEILVPPQRGAP